ncbi:MAG: efflux RND transporter periplasmic adaptor subunit [Pseudomonadota bacterium]
MMKKTRFLIGFTAVTAIAAYFIWHAYVPAPHLAAAVQKSGDPNLLRYPVGAPQLASIRTAPVQQVPLPLAEPLNGRVVYNEDATARISSPINGRVVAIKAQLGDRIHSGQTLLVLDSPDLGSAEADLEKAQADVTVKHLALTRAQTLYQGEALARKDLEAAQADYAAARAEAQRARLLLRNLAPAGVTSNGEGYALRSPIAGVIVDRQVNPGIQVRPDLPNPLFVVTDPSKLWVNVDLPENLLGKVAVGHPVSIEVDANPGQLFTGYIEKIAPTLDPVTRRIMLRCSVDGGDDRLKAEMFARVTLLADKGQLAFRIPNTALVSDGLYSYVFVEQSPGVLRKHRVSLVAQDRDYSYSTDSLKPGERIVTSGALLLNSELSVTQ